MGTEREYDDIPGTYVFDGRRNAEGYHLNMFCKSLDVSKNRQALHNDPDGYLDQFPMTAEQRMAIDNRDWLRMLQLGGNIYYTYKLAAVDGLNMQEIGAAMSGVTFEEFRQMMIDGGRPADGNRYAHEWSDTEST